MTIVCQLFVDPASIDFPPDVFPMAPVTRRNKKWESKFEYGIYDCGINDLAKYGEHRL